MSDCNWVHNLIQEQQTLSGFVDSDWGGDDKTIGKVQVICLN